MTDTPRLNLPLVMAAQAQKHVTVNEALLLLDGMVNLVLESTTVTTPPDLAVEGMAWAVPQDAVNAWAGKAGQIALALGGGWVFLAPRTGWRAFVSDRGATALFGGQGWRIGALTMAASGAGMTAVVEEILHEIAPGEQSVTQPIMTQQGMMIGVTARVVEPITGSLTSWSLGSPGAPDRFGHGLGIAAGSWCRGLLSQPSTVWAPEPLLLSATGGSFTSGAVRIAVHALTLALPGG